MMTIGTPYLKREQDRVSLCAELTVDDRRDTLWFSVDPAYGAYLSAERSDALVVMLVHYAMEHGHDMTFEGVVSEQLYYQVQNLLVEALSRSKPPVYKTRIFCRTTDQALPVAEARGVATGISCGIDSLTTIRAHTQPDCPPGFRLTHLTFFNAGAAYTRTSDKTLNRKGEHVETGRRENARLAAREIGLPLIEVDSNLSEVLKFDYLLTHTYRNCGVAMLLGGLIHRYYYANSGSDHGSVVDFHEANGSYDDFMMHALSLPWLTFYSYLSNFSRLEKTAYLLDYPVAQRHLNVCICEDKNCGECLKCVRTLLSLDALGALQKFDGVFDISKYSKGRNEWLYYLWENRKKEYIREVYAAFLESGFKFPRPVRMRMPLYYIWRTVRPLMPKGLANALAGKVKKRKVQKPNARSARGA